MSIFSILCISLIILSAICAGLQSVRCDTWWVRFSDFPHVQCTVLNAIATFTYFFFTSFNSWFHFVFPVIGLVTLVYQLIIIWPYTRFSDKQVSDSHSTEGRENEVSILEANVYMYNTNYRKLLDRIVEHNPDIVIAIETDKNWESALNAIEKEYPYTIKRPLENTYGLLLYSKLPLNNSSVNFLVEEDIPSFETEVRLRNKQDVKLYVLHPRPPSPTENVRSTERDVELIEAGRSVLKVDMPVIIAGDLNDVAWSHTTRLFQRISGLLDPRIGRGFFNTFHAKYPFFRWPLDHVFHSMHFLVVDMLRPKSIDSDHFPMYINLSLQPYTGTVTNEVPDSVDRDDIKEIIDKIDVINEDQKD